MVVLQRERKSSLMISCCFNSEKKPTKPEINHSIKKQLREIFKFAVSHSVKLSHSRMVIIIIKVIGLPKLNE
jgi:hypothetical protein